MKFATAHKDFTIIDGGGKKISYRAHRDGNKVWVTGKVAKAATVFSHQFKHIAQAKAWMNHTSLRV